MENTRVHWVFVISVMDVFEGASHAEKFFSRGSVTLSHVQIILSSFHGDFPGVFFPDRWPPEIVLGIFLISKHLYLLKILWEGRFW